MQMYNTLNQLINGVPSDDPFLEGYSGLSRVSSRVLWRKIHMCAILTENTANYISLERLINVDFGKKYELPVFLIPQKKIAKMTAKMTMRHSVKQMN